MKALALAFGAAILAIPSSSVAAARVSSNSNCPSSDAISLKLLGLLAAGGPETASAIVRSEGDSMHIEVSTPGEEARQRVVPATGDCEARAETAAFVIAAWLDAMPVGTLRAPGVPPREIRSEPVSDGEDDSLDDAEGEKISIDTHTLLGGGVLGLADGLGASAGLSATVGMPNLIENVGWLMEASLGLPRQMEVGQGKAHIWRPTFSLSVNVALYRKRWLLRAQAGPALGILLVSGTGYQANQSDTSVMWGANVGLCLARPWRRHEAWLRLAGIAWPQGRSILSDQGTSLPNISVPLPSWEVRSEIGFSWGVL